MASNSALTPMVQGATHTGRFTQSGTTAGSDISTTYTTEAGRKYRARELIVWTAGDWVINYTVQGNSFTDTIPVSAAGVRLPLGGADSIDSTTISGYKYTLVF